MRIWHFYNAVQVNSVQELTMVDHNMISGRPNAEVLLSRLLIHIADLEKADDGGCTNFKNILPGPTNPEATISRAGEDLGQSWALDGSAQIL